MPYQVDDGARVLHFEDGTVMCEPCAVDDGYMPSLDAGLRNIWVRRDGACDSCGAER